MITEQQKELLCELIDMNDWKHSWHINVYDADKKLVNEKLRTIISKKLAERFNEMNNLMKGYDLLLELTNNESYNDNYENYVHNPENDMSF